MRTDRCWWTSSRARRDPRRCATSWTRARGARFPFCSTRTRSADSACRSTARGACGRTPSAATRSHSPQRARRFEPLLGDVTPLECSDVERANDTHVRYELNYWDLAATKERSAWHALQDMWTAAPDFAKVHYQATA